MRIRCQFTKEGPIAFISHLDLMNVLRRAMKRAKIPVSYSEGFNPHPKMNVAGALSVGVESLCEYMEVELFEEISPMVFQDQINLALPSGIRVLKCKVLEKKNEINKTITHVLYRIEFVEPIDFKVLQSTTESILAQKEIITQKRSKRGEWRTLNLRDQIYDITFDEKNGMVSLLAILQNSSEGSLKPTKLLEIIEENSHLSLVPKRILKEKVLQITEDQFQELS